MDYNGGNIPGLEGNIALGDPGDQESKNEEAKNGFQPENNVGGSNSGGLNEELNTLDEPVCDTIVSKPNNTLMNSSYPNCVFRREI